MALEQRKPAAPVRGGASVHRVGWRDRLDAALDHHRASARDAALRLRRQWVTSTMTALVIAIALSLPAILWLVLDNLRALSGHVEGQAQVSLFLQLETTPAAQQALAGRLRGRDDVAAVQVITREQALAEFRAQSGYADVLEALEGNPLPPVLVVQPRDASAAGGEALRAQLAAEPSVEVAQLDSEWLQKLAAMLAIGDRLAQALAAGFALAVVLVVLNSIRLAIESRRDEILVVKLVGATDAFVRRPFLYTGLWFGLAGGVLAVLLVSGLVLWVEGPVTTLAGLYGGQFALAGLGLAGSLAVVLAGAGLGLLGAWAAVGRHLGEIEPS